MNYILGSGLSGLIARAVLGDGWKLLPFKRSRFYSTTPALGDEWITYTDDFRHFLDGNGLISDKHRLQRAYSYAGQLIFSDDSFAKVGYLDKLFADQPHPAARHLQRTEFIAFKIPASTLYQFLQTKFQDEILESINTLGKVTQISDHHIKTDRAEFDFDKIVSAIPMDALTGLMGQHDHLPAQGVWYYLVRTPSLNFEGAYEVMVCDQAFDFFKCTIVGTQLYLFHCRADLMNPHSYLQAFLGSKFEIVNSTQIEKAIPLGPPPDLKGFEAKGIYPLGRHGQWDYYMDTSSVLKRVQKI